MGRSQHVSCCQIDIGLKGKFMCILKILLYGLQLKVLLLLLAECVYISHKDALWYLDDSEGLDRQYDFGGNT